MVSTESEMSAHYSPGNLLARLNASLIDDGIDPEHPTMEALASYDQFHGRGLEATLEIADKDTFHREINRVLKPGGWLLLSEVAKGDGGEPNYPMPWAASAHASFLSTPEETRRGLLQA